MQKGDIAKIDTDLENIYKIIQEITEKYIPKIYRIEIYYTSHFCKKILNLARILNQENIGILETEKQDLVAAIYKYIKKNGVEDYLIPHIGWHQITCNPIILIKMIGEIKGLFVNGEIKC